MARTRRPTCACSTSTCTGGVSRFNVLIRDRKTRAGHLYRGPRDADAGPPQRAQRHRRHRGRLRARRCRSTRSARRSRASAASSGASPAPANGTARAIFDDYGHHPVEIAAVLRPPAPRRKQQVIAVVQPHRYSRLQSLFDDFATCFNDADAVIVADVYAGRRAADRGRRPRRPRRGHQGARPPQRHGARRRRAPCRRSCARSPSPATTSSASAPATSRNGPMRLPEPAARRGMSTSASSLARDDTSPRRMPGLHARPT